jgi:hypothetical protein
MTWTPITQQVPPTGKEVLFCCEIDDIFTGVGLGTYWGKWTDSPNAVVMEIVGVDDDWSPCSHWMPVPLTPDQLSAAPMSETSDTK